MSYPPAFSYNRAGSEKCSRNHTSLNLKRNISRRKTQFTVKDEKEDHMKKISALFITAVIAITCLGLTACGDSKFKVAWPNAELLGSGKTITADYTGTPSTGYEWTIELEGDGVLEETEHTTKDAAPTESEALVGTAVVEHYAFKVVGDGETRIIARYARSWEASPDDLEYICKVTVKDGKISMMMIDDELTDSLMAALDESLPL